MERKWWLVIAGCITHAVSTGFTYFGMSAFFPSFERTFGRNPTWFGRLFMAIGRGGEAIKDMPRHAEGELVLANEPDR